MKLIMEDNTCEIKETKKIILKEKFTLVTEEGTVISSGFYSSTICDDEVDENVNLEQNLEKWKERHNFMSLKNN